MRRFLSAVVAGVLAFAGRSTPPAGQERRRSAKAGPDLSAGQRERRDPVQEVEEGTVFTLLVPDSVMEASYLSSGIISYRLALTRGPNGLEINGRTDWQGAGPPCMRELSASPIQHKGQRFFYTESGSQIHISFDPQTVDIRSALPAFMIAGPPSSEAARKYRQDHDSFVRGIHGKSQ
jgi:hypothetical protein